MGMDLKDASMKELQKEIGIRNHASATKQKELSGGGKVNMGKDIYGDRSWAVDLTQKEFNDEWAKRYPRSDVVPDKNFWLIDYKSEDRSMKAVNPVDYEAEEKFLPPEGAQAQEDELKDRKEAEVPAEGLQCPGCGFLPKTKTKKNNPNYLAHMNLGLKAHMRKCTKEITRKKVTENG